jgi:hypothetical protein
MNAALQQVTHSNTTYLTDPKQRVTTLNGTKGAKQWVYVKITTDGTVRFLTSQNPNFPGFSLLSKFCIEPVLL